MKDKRIVVSVVVVILVVIGMWYFLTYTRSTILPIQKEQNTNSQNVLSVDDLSKSYGNIFDQLQSGEYDIGLYGNIQDKIIPASAHFKNDKFIDLQKTILNSYIDRNSYYAESPTKIGNNIYFTNKTGLYKVDVLKREITQLYKDEKLMPSVSIVPTPDGISILTGWSSNIDPVWGDSSSGSIVETNIETNQSKTYPFTIPEEPHLKVSQTFSSFDVSRGGKFIWVHSLFDTTDIQKTDANFNERMHLVNGGKMPMINRTTGEVRYVSFNEVSTISVEDLPNWQGWPGYYSDN